MGLVDTLVVVELPNPLRKEKKNDFLSKSFPEYSPTQKLKILKIKLQFLRDCKVHKRPPPSLRINGASALIDDEKLYNFSLLESTNLEVAIKNKIKEIRELKLEVESQNIQNTPL